MLSSLDRDVVEEVWFASGPFRLQGELAYPESQPPRGTVALAGPHPMLGGRLGNNVVRGVAAGLAQRSSAVLSFNYRGVAGSEGKTGDPLAGFEEFWSTSHASGELEYANDFRAAVAALGDMLGQDLPLALVGYSFGCTLLPHVDCGANVPLALIAPTLGHHDYTEFARIRNPMLVVAPEGDFAADDGLVEEWFQTLPVTSRLVRGKWDNHFFRGHEDRLAALIYEFTTAAWRNPCR